MKFRISILIIYLSALSLQSNGQEQFLEWKDTSSFPLKTMGFEKMFYRKVTEGREFLLINAKNGKFAYAYQSGLGIYFFSSGIFKKLNNSDTLLLLKSVKKTMPEEAERIKRNSKFYKFRYFSGKDSMSYIKLQIIGPPTGASTQGRQ
jgi:hypothetical protein